MAIRVSDSEVRSVIETDSDISTDPFIRVANALTEKVDSEDTDSELSSELLFGIELNLAAHFYETRDSQLIEEKSGDASGVYQGQTGMGLASSKWGQTAMLLDLTGYLAKLNKQMLEGRKVATVDWLGLPVSSQTEYPERD